MKNQPSLLREILDRPGQEINVSQLLDDLEMLRKLGVKSAGLLSEIVRRLDATPGDCLLDQPSLLIN